MSLWNAYLEDIIFSYRKQKGLAEKAFRQVEDENFFTKLGEHSNSIAIIIKHVAGNLASRWTDLLTTDGDKPWRDRDAEFIIGPEDTRQNLITAWEGHRRLLRERRRGGLAGGAAAPQQARARPPLRPGRPVQQRRARRRLRPAAGHNARDPDEEPDDPRLHQL